MFVDYILLNCVTKSSAYPLPLINDILHSFCGAKFFTNINLFLGYYQIAMAEESIPLTAFVTRFGQFEFTRMPLGLTRAPRTFQAAMDQLFSDYQYCVTVYLDGITVYSTTFEQQLLDLKKVLNKIQGANLSINASKLDLCAQELHLLGQIINAKGKMTDPAKLKAIQTWPTPINTKEVLSFLGTANYYRAFVPNFSKKARPL